MGSYHYSDFLSSLIFIKEFKKEKILLSIVVLGKVINIPRILWIITSLFPYV